MRPKLTVAVVLALLTVTQAAEPGDFLRDLQAPTAQGEVTPACPGQNLPLTPADPTPKFVHCAWISQSPCPTTWDCGYQFDGTCCIARCTRPQCWTICFYEPQPQ